MKQDPDEPMAKIASKLISTKRTLERSHLLPTRVFEGYGANQDDEEESSDPALRLRELVKERYKKELKRDHKIIKHKRDQSGGFAQILVPIAASVLATLAGKVYDTIRDRIKGKGYDLPHLKNKDEKHDFVVKLLKQI